MGFSKGQMGTTIVILMLSIASVFFIFGIRTSSSEVLGKFVQIDGEGNTTDDQFSPFNNGHDFTPLPTLDDEFTVSDDDEISGNVTGLADTEGGGSGGLLLFIDTGLQFIKAAFSIIVIMLTLPLDFMLNLGLPSAFGIVVGVILMAVIIIALIEFLTGRKF